MIPSIDLIKRYNVSGPRYTSYPTAVEFRQDPDSAHRLERVRAVLEGDHTGRTGRELSLYFHIPFCYSLCWYCGCTKIITRNRDRGDLYLDYLQREMDLVAHRLEAGRKIRQIHFGGGTPTFLRPNQLQRLGRLIQERFPFDPETEFSVEIDPRRCDHERIAALREIGCNRASLGVQDTNRQVQEAIHRIQPFEQTEQVTAWLREEGIRQINFDLIYGLPKQTLETFKQSLDDVMQLSPDRLAVYSYAHLPTRLPSQRLLNERDLPTVDEKLRMFAKGVEHLTDTGMRWIGMDHFASEQDSLTRALENGTLQRNFQGYSTWAETDLIAFGMSGISQFDSLYYQNTKDLEAYYLALDQNELPVVRTLELDREDRLRRDLIMQVMCRHEIDYDEMSARWNLPFSERFSVELNRLEAMENDGLVRRETDRLVITKSGRFFLRNIAMAFDAYLHSSGKTYQFSKTV